MGHNLLPSGSALGCVQRSPRDLVSRIDRCFSDFAMNLSGPGIVGLSGGKDSTGLLLLLRELGLDVIPAVVDLGYASFDAAPIVSQARAYGFDAVVLGLSSRELASSNTRRAESRLEADIALLNNGAVQTPCTLCSQAKRQFLTAYATSRHCKWVALGHNLEDFLATLLKDYFILRYYAAHRRFDASTFRQFIASETVSLTALRSMVLKGQASTMAVQLNLAPSILLVRPMIYISETELRNLVAGHGMRVFGSGCSHEEVSKLVECSVQAP